MVFGEVEYVSHEEVEIIISNALLSTDTLVSCSKFCNTYFTNGPHQLPLRSEVESVPYKLKRTLANPQGRGKTPTALSIKWEEPLMPSVKPTHRLPAH